MENSETILFTNHFGSVTNKRVTLKYKSGVEDIPVGQISSVRFEHIRNYFPAIGGGLGAIAILFFMLSNLNHLGGAEVIVMILVILFLGLLGLANWVGHHDIVISASGNNRKPLKVELAKTREGRQFVDAVKKVIFK